MDKQWREIGKVVLLQIQQQPMKVGDVHRVFSPEQSLLSVDTFQLSREGVSTVLDGKTIVDAHHARHPRTRYKEVNPVSIGFTSHYQKMQDKYGDHMVFGIAGENIIVEVDDAILESQMEKTVAIRNSDGELIVIKGIFAMPPCEPFSRFCLRQDEVEASLMKETLQFLHYGTRGFAGVPENDGEYVIQLGDTLLIEV